MNHSATKIAHIVNLGNKGSDSLMYGRGLVKEAYNVIILG